MEEWNENEKLPFRAAIDTRRRVERLEPLR